MSNLPPRTFMRSSEPEVTTVRVSVRASALPPASLWHQVEDFFGRRFTLKEQIFFTKRLSFLVRAGVPILEGLSIIQTQTKSPAKARIFETLITDVSNGQYLSSSISKHPHFLAEFGVSIIRIGETSGILEQNLTYLADELAKKSALQKKVLGALVYPIFITVATLGVTGLLTVYIFPKIMPIFTSLHVTLPLTTRILIAVSAYLRVWGLLTIAVLILLVVLFFFLRTRYVEVQAKSDSLLLHLPLAGAIARSYNLANFCRTMGLMLRSGIPIATAMEITADTTPNLMYRRAYRELAECLKKGEPMSRNLNLDTFLFPSIVTHMIAVGEKTGSLSQTLMYLADMYELEVDDLTKNLSSSIEPILMLIMGLLVGLIAVSVITPIYAITQHLSPR